MLKRDVGLQGFLDAQASLVPTHVSLSLSRKVILLNFHSIAIDGVSGSLREKLKKADPSYCSILGLGRILQKKLRNSKTK